MTTVDAADTLTITATVTNDKNSDGVTWSTTGGALSNQSATGVTFTAPAATSSSQTVTITATSVADTTKSATLTLTIPALPKITTGSLTAGTVGSNYSATLTVTGGIPPYTWTLVSGTLPSCLTIVNSASGTSITGTLTAACAGSYNLTFKVTDSGTPTPLTATTATLSLTIAAAPAFTFSGTMPGTATFDAAYTGSAAASGGAGALTYSVASGSLPTGLSLDTTSGAVTGTPTAAGTFNFTIKAADAFGDSATSQTYTIVVGAEKPTLTFAAIPTQTYGNAPFMVSATSASSGAVTYSVTSGPASISGSTVTLTGVGAVVLGASQAASGNFAAATATTSFTVNPETPTLKFAAIPTQTYGAAPITVSASSPSTGAITYSVTSGPATISGATVTLTGIGTVVLGASQAAFGDYAAATTTTSFLVNAEPPNLVFAKIPTQTYGAVPFTVSATSPSNGAITYSVMSGPATISGSTVTLTGVGTVVLVADQAASGDFIAATTSTSFAVNPGTPALTFAAIPTQTFGAMPFNVSASSASTGAITYSVTSGPATISGATVTLTGIGTVVLSASQAANGNYTAASTTTSFIVNPETPILTFAAIPPPTYGNAPFMVSASSASTGAITYSVTSGPATISGATVTLTGVGTVVLGASQAANGNFAATTTSTSFVVAGEVTTLTFVAIPTKTYGAAPFNVSATSASNGAITYSVTSGPATISGSTVTITGAGTVVLGASQAGSGDYAPATTSISFAVNPATPILTFTAIPTQTFGAVPFTVSATSASTGAVTYSVTSGPATITGATVTLTGAGTVMLSANQAATANYTAATTATSFMVNPGTPILTFASIPTETYGNAPFTVSATSLSTGAVTYSVTSGPATISGAAVTLTGVGLVTLGASQVASANYTAATTSISFTVNPETPILTFAAIPQQTYGNAPFAVSASSASNGAITYSVTSGPATISGATVTITGAGTVMLSASQAGSGNYGAATTSASFTVAGEATPLTFTTIPTQTYGAVPFTVSATSASVGAVTYSVTSGPATISGATVTLTGVGTVVLGASQAASGNYAAGTATTSFTVNPETPTLTFAAIPTEIYGNAPFAVSATSASNGAVTYSVTSGPATISGATVTITGVGTVVLGANQAASGNYTAATASASFTVNPETPTLTFAAIPTQTYGNAPFAVSASSASSGAITYSVTSGPATISGATVTITGVGTVVLGASQAANGNYTAATATASFTVNAETPTLIFTAIPTETYGNAPFAVSASSASSGAITYSVTSGPATISAATVTLTGIGTVVLGASQVANADYAAATATTSFTVNAETPTLTFAAIPTETYGNAPFTVSATSASAGAVTYSVTSGPATISGATVTITGVGTVVLGASQAAFGDYAAAAAATSFTVNPETPTLTFAPIPTQTYGNAPFAVSASSASSGAITYSVSSGPATISGSTVTLTGIGLVTLKASQAASGNYAAATGTTSFTVNAETPTLTFAAIPSKTFGDPSFAVSASSASSGAITYSVTSGPATISGASVTLTGAGTVVLGASQVASGDYAAATATTSFTVNPAVTITTSTPLPTGVVNTPYSQMLGASGGSGGYSWTTDVAGTNSLASVNLTLSMGGLVSGTPLSAATATFAATVTDSTSHSATVTFTVKITNMLTITTTTLPAAYTNALYSQTLTAAGGTGLGFNWTTTGANNLSTFNLTLSGGGLLSGTPTSTGTVSFTAQVKDSGNNTATQLLTVPVYAPLALPAANPVTLGGATTNVAYSGTIVATGGSGSGYVFTVTGLPSDGLANAANNGTSTLTISGTATLTQTVTFQASVKDGLGNTAGPVTYTIVVKPPTPLTLPAGGALAGATTNVAYSTMVVASGGSGSGYVFSVNGSAIPNNGTAVLIADGISVSDTGTNSLVISGTPTLTQTVTLTNVTVKDGAGDNAGPDTYTIAVKPPTPLTLQGSGALPGATTNLAYSTMVVASGGSGSGYVFSVNGSQIPVNGTAVLIADGISVSNTGTSSLVISGTPTLTQTVTLTNVTVKDSAGDNAGPDTYTIAVNPPTPLTLQGAGALPGATTGQAYNGSVSAFGGSGSGYVFTVNGVQIPINGSAVAISDSISVSNLGGATLSITGTPTAAQTVTLTSVTVKDGAGDGAGPDTYTIAVNPPTPLTLQAAGPLVGATTNQAYNGLISASGGSGSGYVFTVNGIQIPINGTAVLIADGISVTNFGTTSLNITGTPTTTQTVTFTNVTVKDGANDTAGPDTYTIAVNPPTPLTLQSSGPLPGAITGQSYNVSINASGGSGSGYVFSVNGSAIPNNGTAVVIADGIAVSSLGGTTLSVTGTPTTTQTVTITNVTVKDSANDSAGPDTYTIAVNPATPLTLQSPGPLPGATTGQSYDTSINASGGSGSGYVFTVNGTQIPINGTQVLIADSISVSSAGGNSLSISGTPTLTQTVTLTNVTVKDSANDTAGPDTYTIAVNPPGFTVSGQINLYNNCGPLQALPTFTVSINTNPVQQTTTDSSGNYSFAGIPAGTYTITPSIAGATSVFNPAKQAGVVVSGNSVSGENFSVSLGYTVSGTVSYSGAKTGQVYLLLNNNNCGGNNSTGTSITEAQLTSGGAFTIRGVTPGVYTLQGWMDDLGFGSSNANDPVGSTSSVTITGANLTGVSVTMTDPAAVTLSSPPTMQSVSPFSEGVVIPFKAIKNNNGAELATSYTVEWSTTAGFTAVSGQTSFPATGSNGANVWLVNLHNVTGLSAGGIYYFRVQGVAGSSTSSWSSTVGPVTIAAPSGGVTVNGTVNFTGTATGPLYAGFYDQNTNTVYATEVGSQASPPVSGASYTVDVPPGSNYINFGIVDQNNNGIVDPGDINDVNGNSQQSSVTIPATGPVTEPALTLPSGNSTATVTTEKQVITNQGGTYTSYSVSFSVSGVVKLPVAAALVSATNPDLIFPADIGECNNCGNGQFSYFTNLTGYTPNVGDSYGLKITYSDGTQETLPVAVGTVPSAAASNLAPNLTTSNVSLTPTFTWTDPANAANYNYSFTLWDQNGNQIWQIPGNNSNSNGFSSSITSITWGTDPTGGGSTPTAPNLNNSATYTWQVQTRDSSGNQTQTQVNFTTPEGTLSLPAASKNPLGSALVNSPYSGFIVASGGSGSGYSFTVNGNTVPSNDTPLVLTDGLSAVNGSDVALLISGTPTTATGVSLTVSVEDGQGHTAGPVTYTLPVSAGPNGANNSYLTGQYVCELGGFLDSNSSRWASLFSLTANGAAGTFTNGIFDSNANSYASEITGTVTGTFKVGSDNNGLATFTTSVGTIGGATTSNWTIALTNFAGPKASAFEMVEIDDLGSSPSGHHGTGQCVLATPAAFTASTISGHSFAFQLSGEDGGGGPRIDLGRFSASNGSVTTGVTDQVKGTQVKLGNTAFTGSYTLPTTPSFATYGRYTLTFTATAGSVDYAVYTIDANRMFMLLSDTGDGTSAGQMRTQQQATYSAANLDGNFVLYEEGFEVSGGALSGLYSQVYEGAGNGAGNFTINESYQDDNGTFSSGSANATLPVTFDSTNPGRVTFAPGSASGFMYMYDNNSAFIVTAISNSEADSGSFEPQTQTTFTDAAVAGNYMLGGLPPESPHDDGIVGEVDVLNTGSITSNLSIAGEGGFSYDQAQSGLTYTWISDVYGTLSTADNGQPSQTCIVITSSKTVCISDTSSSPSVTILQQ
ncbi:MAG: putative Ig domain-containing protein [Terracidiphilus sp.]